MSALTRRGAAVIETPAAPQTIHETTDQLESPAKLSSIGDNHPGEVLDFESPATLELNVPSPDSHGSEASACAARDESWERAAPVHARARGLERDRRKEVPPAKASRPLAPRLHGAAAAPPIVRELPHSAEAEEHLLASCMLDGADVMPRCEAAGLSPASFYDPKHAILFDCIASLHRRGLPSEAANVAEELKTTRQLDQVGGYPFLLHVSSRVPTTAQAGYFIEKVRELSVLRQIIRAATGAVEDCYGFTGGDIAAFAAEIEANVGRVTRDSLGEATSSLKRITEFDYPTYGDPNVLLGSDDYLGRGGGMLLVSHAGAGKSSFILNAIMSWALGRPWMGIRCNGPLRTLVIQAEDSDRYIGKLRRSFSHIHNLTEAEEKQLGANCAIVRLKGKCGNAFFAELRRHVQKFEPDLVVINPIYLYAEGDISRAEFAQPFLVGLDEVNRDEKFGYILVHHTGKPQKKAPGNNQRAELDEWETIYQGFGSSYLANWPRCSALLEPRSGEKSRYWLKLGKAGVNAGVVREAEHQASKRLEPVTKIAIRHSTARMDVAGVSRPVICWVPDTDETVDQCQTEASKPRRGAGRPEKYTLAEFPGAFPRGEENRLPYGQVYRKACDSLSVPRGTFNGLLQRWVASGEIRRHEDGRYFV